MARITSFRRLAAFALTASMVAAQSQGSTPAVTSSPSTTATPSSTITPTASTSDTPLSIWNVAESLLSSYYPSTTLTQVASLSWPTDVVIGSSTYSVHSATPSAAEQTGSPNKSENKSGGLNGDARLGVVIGVVVGSIILAVIGVVFCCLWRRKRNSGNFFLRRPTPSVTDSDLDQWRSPINSEPSMTQYGGPAGDWTDKYNRVSTNAHPVAPPMAMHPAFVRHHSSQSTSEDNPFFTPQERSEHSYDMAPDGTSYREMDANDTAYPRRSSDSARRASRPPTPFDPMAMMGMSHQPMRENPFTSPEDAEADDVISPIIPVRSPERRHSPMVHYPSWSEVSEFDFTGSESHGSSGPRSMRGQRSYEEGDDGWRPTRDSVVGRHELA